MASRIDSLSADLGNVPDAAVTPAAPAAPVTPGAASADAGERTGFRVLSAISFAHMLNDMIQSLILAIYPMLKGGFNLSFVQIGLLTLTYQITASLLQPLVGLYTDKHPKPHSLAVGMGFTLGGLLLLSIAPSYGVLLVAAALVGTGSSIFHPESSRVARMASGGRHGLAQSIFQVGGNVGSAAGPLLAAVVVHTQGSIAWLSLAALLAIAVLWRVGGWYGQRLAEHARAARKAMASVPRLPARTVARAMAVLMVLLFSKYFYMASLGTYYTFYLMERFGVPQRSAQLYLFAFLFAVAVGTILGGPIGDRIGRKRVIWFSILGVAPFTLMLPHADLFWTAALSLVIGFILASAFSAILVFAQELIPGKVGMVSGLFFGLAFGMGGIGAAVLGGVADAHGIEAVYRWCAYLPLLGVLAVFLPETRTRAS